MKETIKEAVLALAETDPELAAALAKEATAKVRQAAPAGTEADKFISALEKAINTKNMFTIVFTDRGLMPGAIDIWYAAVPPGTTGVDYMNAKVRLILTVYGFDSEGNLKGDKIRVEPTISRGIKARKKTARPELVLKHTIKMIQAAIAAETTAEADTTTKEETMNDTIKQAVLALAETNPELAAELAKEATAGRFVDERELVRSLNRIAAEGKKAAQAAKSEDYFATVAYLETVLAYVLEATIALDAGSQYSSPLHKIMKQFGALKNEYSH